MFLSCALAVYGETIREVDFNNFTYPLSGSLLGHDRLQWLPTETPSARKPIRLINGKNLKRTSSFVMDGKEYPQWEGFTLQSVTFADVTGDAHEEAIVVLHYSTGGTQQTDYVYIYSFAGEKPKLLAYFHTGDRAYSGLYRVFGANKQLVIELLDPAKSSGGCCSSGVVRTGYKWQNGRFQQIGPAKRVPLENQ